ncbi:putative quinol monooxygenase [Roseobacter weihaiensis]|uniref:putative quinol monooxygenase n=1 Tax=Roseobacter weihaiensis TaxID=2763262 RepID=UPI001D0B7143|nr:putative quinol monooxygenase [Roseobacter sp. H9]
MFAVVVTLTLKTGTTEQFLPLMRTNAATSLRQEEGCHQFDVATDPARPDEVFLYEVYTNETAFAGHLKTPHFAEFDAATAAMIADKEIKTYRKVIP